MKKEIDFGKRLAYGCLRLPIIDKGEIAPGFRDDSEVDIAYWQTIVDKGMANGYNYFDTSWFYHNGNSERAIGQCVAAKYPRDSFIISDKMPVKFMKKASEMETIFNEQLKKCQVDYFDFYLIHALSHETYEKWSKLGMFEFLQKKREEGKFREFGISIHETPEFLEKVLSKHPEIDFVMLQINYLDWDSPAIRSRELYEVAMKYEKPIVVMEPCKGGTLANPPEEAAKLMRDYNPEASFASWAYRWVGSLPGVRVVAAGMPKMEFLEDNMKTFDDFKPLNEEEQAIISKVVEIINAKTAIACTNCKYCEEACPKDIPAGDYFMLYNEYFRTPESTSPNDVNTQALTYGSLIEHRTPADECIECGLCEEVCPQHLDIAELLKEKIVDDLNMQRPDAMLAAKTEKMAPSN
ncbi:MAG: 4Fe-4S dicluster domain-containing protein [Eubacteriaceae bacterium]|jgi:predicted aldo/keto reductase-like oxidoreductase|nr:4Fe-4S dicluster domain-containing protein [Eubacteriaceae bacterium]